MRCALLIGLFVSGSAVAHTGGTTVNAVFTAPAPPLTTMADLGLVVEPLTFATADASYDVQWSDGDMDPTGHFTFYYLDHQPNFGVLADDIETLATLMEEVGKPGVPVQIWASGTCVDGMGVVCPDAGVRDSRNGFTWNTAGLADGTYWPIAINNDPPFKLYSPSLSPVRVAHLGRPAPPAAVIVRPDGFGSFDKSYRVQWLAVGKAPLKFDLAYGSSESGEALAPVSGLAKDVMPAVMPDGTQYYDWNVSALAGPKVYYLRVTVIDADGNKSFTDSRYGLSVYHPASDGGLSLADLSAQPDLTQDPGTGCDVTDHPHASAALLPLALAPLALLLLLALLRRRVR